MFLRIRQSVGKMNTRLWRRWTKCSLTTVQCLPIWYLPLDISCLIPVCVSAPCQGATSGKSKKKSGNVEIWTSQYSSLNEKYIICPSITCKSGIVATWTGLSKSWLASVVSTHDLDKYYQIIVKFFSNGAPNSHYSQFSFIYKFISKKKSRLIIALSNESVLNIFCSDLYIES